MTPWQIAKESESSQQIALFCFAACATDMGFKNAMDERVYMGKSYRNAFYPIPVPELKFLHHIPNGGSRGDTAKSAAIAGGRLKAEGVKAGVWDLCWLLPRGKYHGLIIEMKAANGALSKDQIEYGLHAVNNGYKAEVCYSWLEAAKVLEDYYNLGK